MKKYLKITLILFTIILLDTLQAMLFNRSPLLSYRVDNVDKGLFVNTYYCSKNGKVEISSHFKNTKFNCAPVKIEIGYYDNCDENSGCRETIDLLKNTDTAWDLTFINSDGTYTYDNNSFINFNGVGKNKYTYYKNTKNNELVFEKKGTFFINSNNQIILTPEDDESNKITCVLGEEKDLVAIMNCNNNFGTFSLLKIGKLKLPDLILDTISKTKKIVVKCYQESESSKIKTITDKDKIDEFVSIIKKSNVWTGPVTMPMPIYDIYLYDDRDVIAEITYKPNFEISIREKRYALIDIDEDFFDDIIE